MENIKVAVIGLGGVAQLVHMPLLKKMGNVTVTAVAELNKARLLSVAERFNIVQRYTDYTELLAKDTCDAVIIATPTHTHRQIAIDCMTAGKHVLVEKPIARTFKEAEEMLQAAKANKVQLMVGMNMRYRPDIMLLKSLVNSGDLGDLFYVKTGWLRKKSSEGKWFTRKEEAGGGVIFDIGIVLLDLSLWLLNFPKITSVSTQNYSHNTSSVEDTSVSMIRCQPNLVISLEASWSIASDKDTFHLEVFGTKGSAFLNPLRVYRKTDISHFDLSAGRSENPTVLYRKAYENELKHFIGAVKGFNPVLSPADNALNRMQIIESMYLSASKNKEIVLG